MCAAAAAAGADAATVQWEWQLVGHSDVRRSPGSAGWRVRELQAAVGRELCIAPRWLSLSMRSRQLEGDEQIPARSMTPLVSLLLPGYARACSEAGAPRSKRHRVTNQAAVAALAWQPGLLLHECPGEGGGRGPAQAPYHVFISNIPGFPAPLLRLDMDCEAPTVGSLVKRLHEVTGTDLRLVFGQHTLRGGRQYLHRLGIVAGCVLTAEVGCEQTSPPTPKSRAGLGSSAATPHALPALDIDELAQHEDKPEPEPEPGRRIRGKTLLVSAQTGALWSGSSRKRTLSSGQCGPRGPGGQPSLLAARPGALLGDKASAEVRECPPQNRGGFLRESDASA